MPFEKTAFTASSAIMSLFFSLALLYPLQSFAKEWNCKTLLEKTFKSCKMGPNVGCPKVKTINGAQWTVLTNLSAREEARYWAQYKPIVYTDTDYSTKGLVSFVCNYKVYFSNAPKRFSIKGKYKANIKDCSVSGDRIICKDPKPKPQPSPPSPASKLLNGVTFLEIDNEGSKTITIKPTSLSPHLKADCTSFTAKKGLERGRNCRIRWNMPSGRTIINNSMRYEILKSNRVACRANVKWEWNNKNGFAKPKLSITKVFWDICSNFRIDYHHVYNGKIQVYRLRLNIK